MVAGIHERLFIRVILIISESMKYIKKHGSEEITFSVPQDMEKKQRYSLFFVYCPKAYIILQNAWRALKREVHQ